MGVDPWWNVSIEIFVTVYPSAAINPAGSPGGWLGSLLDRYKHQSRRSSPEGGLKAARTETEAIRVLIRPRLTLRLLEPLHLGRKDDGNFGVAPNVKLRRASRRHLSQEASQANPQLHCNRLKCYGFYSLLHWRLEAEGGMSICNDYTVHSNEPHFLR